LKASININKRAEEIYNEICSAIKLTAKEKRLYKYILEWAARKDDKNPTIGEKCKAMPTTPKTYFKTLQSLRAKGLMP
jgi:hypothetical protein